MEMAVIKDYLNKVTLTQDENELGEKVSLELETLGGAYALGSTFEVSIAGEDRQFFVSGKTRDVHQNGPVQEWATNLKGTSPLAQAIKKAPKKTQAFVTMTNQEFLKFVAETERLWSLLDYVPLVRFGDDYGGLGWSTSAIAEVISDAIGIPIIWNCPDYDVKEFRVEPTQSYLSALLSLANAFNPMVYYLGGTIVIIESLEKIQSPSIRSLSTQPVRQVGEEVVRKDKPSQVRALGNLGMFIKERFKGKVFGTSFTYQSPAGGFTARNTAFGTASETAIAESGSMSFVSVFFSSSVFFDPDTGIAPDFTQEILNRVTGLDVFGNPGYVLSETRTIKMWRRDPDSLFANVITFSITKTVYQYDKTDPRYLRPREFGDVLGKTQSYSPGRASSLSQYIWQVAGGNVVFANYNDLEETRIYYLYRDTGELISQNTIKTALCYSDDGLADTDPLKEWKQAKGLKKDDVSVDGVWKKMVVENELINYQQINKDSYKAERQVLSLDKEGRLKSLPSDVQIVQAGSVQGSRENLRKMQVYAETGAPQVGDVADMSAVMDVPSQEVTINTPSWAAMERILPVLTARLHSGEITRTYEVPEEWNLYPGLAVSADAWQNQAGESIEAPGLTTLFMAITGFEITRSGGRSRTRFTVRGRLL